MVCFKVTTKSRNVATRTAEPRRVKTVQNLQRSKASNASVDIEPRGKVGGLKSFIDLEACDFVTATITYCCRQINILGLLNNIL
jgi:hypothetical protein